MLLHCHQVAHEMQELTRKVLVDEQEFHRGTRDADRRRASH
jgi:hypothetical protein